MYFCGWTLPQVIGRDVPRRLLAKGINMSFEFAAYAMMELKGDESAMMVHGNLKNDPEPRAWVEYVTKSGERRVRDYCSEFLEMSYLSFHNSYYPDTERIYLDYIFWTKYMENLYNLAQSPDTSYIVSGLSIVRPKFKDGKFCGVSDFGYKHVDVTDGTEFIPTVIKNPDGKTVLLTRELFDSLMH